MSCTSLFHSIDLPLRAGLARQFLLAGAALLFVGSVLAQAPAKPMKVTGAHTVSDSVRLAGSKITGGWRETAADGSWRRVEFVLDREAGSITFGDGERGRRPPGAARYSYAGAGKGGKVTHTEARAFAGASPALLARANQSSPIPKGVATRIRELGGDFRLLQRLMDESHRLKELGSAFDAARRPSDNGGVFGGRPGGSPGEGNWSDPRRGVGRGSQASDGSKTPDYDGGPKDPDRGNTGNGEIRHADGTTTTFSSWSDANGSGHSETHKDADGNTTHGEGWLVDSHGNRTTTSYVVRITGEVYTVSTTVTPEGHRTVQYGSHRGGGTPSETPYSGRGGFDEAWLYKSAPWLMDALYTNWKRENDLLVSGGRIAQPGRGEVPSQAPGETNRVGANAVVNCGDSNTNPCAGAESTETDARERLGALTQPPRDGLTGGPLGGTGGSLGGGGGPFPVPNPQYQK